MASCHAAHSFIAHMVSGVTSYGALGHVPPLELVQVVIFTLHVCSVAFPVHVKLVT